VKHEEVEKRAEAGPVWAAALGGVDPGIGQVGESRTTSRWFRTDTQFLPGPIEKAPQHPKGGIDLA
jgi:hypothetical protein